MGREREGGERRGVRERWSKGERGGERRGVREMGSKGERGGREGE